MRLRNANNAASTTILLVLFALLGTACAIFVIAAGFEPYVVQSALVIYLCIGGPLLAASQLETTTPHKSFRLASTQNRHQPANPRRLRLFIAYIRVALAVAFASTATTIWAVGHFPALTTSAPMILLTFSLIALIPFLSIRLTQVTFATIALKRGWMTREESKQFIANSCSFPESLKQPDKGTDSAQPQ